MPNVRDGAFKVFGKDASIAIKGTKVSMEPVTIRVVSHQDAMLSMAIIHVKGHAAANDTIDDNVAFQQAARTSIESRKIYGAFVDLL